MLPSVIDPARVIKDALAQRTDPPKTQTKLASAVELSWAQWATRMSGAVSWRLDELERIAAVLGVDLCDLVRDEDAR